MADPVIDKDISFTSPTQPTQPKLTTYRWQMRAQCGSTRNIGPVLSQQSVFPTDNSGVRVP
eukprot:1788878-Pleurochrysis_carterae.AAC.1